MTRTLKALGLTLMAVCALGAITAAGASAATFNSGAEKTIVTGSSESNHVFTASGFSVECTTAEFKGTQVGTAVSTLTVHPTYTGCTSSLGNAPVDTTGCDYVFNATTNGTGHLPAAISCTASSVIKVTAPGCTLSFGTQNPTGGVVATNLGSGSTADVTVDATVTATFSKSGFGCFVISGTTGSYSGPTTLKGYVDEGTSGNIDEGATYTEGAQTGISWK